MLALPFNPFRKQQVVLSIGTWFFVGMFLVFVRPSFVQNLGFPDSYLPLIVFIFLGLFWTLLSVSGRWKRSLLWSLLFIVGLWLRIFSLFSFIHLLLLLSFGIVWEYYWHLSHQPNL